MEIYKISATGKRLPKVLKNKDFYFQEKRTAEALVKFFETMVKEKVKWKAEIVYPLSHDEAFKQITQAYEVNNV